MHLVEPTDTAALQGGSSALVAKETGAPLLLEPQVLRHNELKTTAIYARVDRQALRPLALPWPGARP